MNIMKKHNSSIQFKTLTLLILFSVAILVVMWFFQIIFLRVYYEKYQLKSLRHVEKVLNRQKYTLDEIERIAYDNDICIEYFYDDRYYLFNGLNNDCLLNTKSEGIKNIIINFIDSDKSREVIKLNNPNNDSKSIMYNIKVNDGYLFLNTSLEDVDSITSILRNKLIYVTMIIIVLAILMSFHLSKTLNEPIINITNEAKKLSKGNLKLNFEESNIKEIDELANTLIYANNEINKTDELRRDLLANVSHDLKTPLTMIKAYAEMLRDIDNLSDDKKRENLNIIIDETDRLNILVNDILNLSKLESNKETLDKSEFDLVELIKKIVKKFDILVEKEKYEFILDMPKKAYVFGDKNKISQVIYNLVNNAVNYTGKDNKVYINVIENKKSYLVEIKDTGKGIKEEELNIIWDKYYKNEKNHKRNKVGTGVGLSIVKNILESHQFKYGVTSTINKGTTFYFEIEKIGKKFLKFHNYFTLL